MTYVSISDWLKKTFGQKIYRLSLSTGCSCPNRDGKSGFGGCVFCSEGGSGDFASPPEDIQIQIERAKKLVDQKFPHTIPQDERRYIAYFQSFTNTYAAPEKLEPIFMSAIKRNEIVALSIATRPDCLPPATVEMLSRLNKIKPVWVELGLQTVHESTAKKINRCYPLEVFDDAYRRLKIAGLYVVVHVILYLPGETKDDMLSTADYISKLDPVLDGIKIQLLHVLKGTPLEKIYREKPFHLPTLEEYCSFIPEYISHLDPRTVIHRLTGDGPKRLLIAPTWTADKKRVINTLKKSVEEYEAPVL